MKLGWFWVAAVSSRGKKMHRKESILTQWPNIYDLGRFWNPPFWVMTFCILARLRRVLCTIFPFWKWNEKKSPGEAIPSVVDQFGWKQDGTFGSVRGQCIRDSTPLGKSSFDEFSTRPSHSKATSRSESKFDAKVSVRFECTTKIWSFSIPPAHVADHATFSWSMFGDIHWTDFNELWGKTYSHFSLLSATGDNGNGLENFWEKSIFSIFRLQARSTSDFPFEISPLLWKIWPWNKGDSESQQYPLGGKRCTEKNPFLHNDQNSMI